MFWSASERNSPAIYLGLSLRLCSNIRKNQNLYDRFKKTFPPKMFHVLYIQTIPNDINWFLQVIQVLCNFFQQEWYWSLIIDLIKLPIILLLPTCGVIELTITPTKPAHWLWDAIKSKSENLLKTSDFFLTSYPVEYLNLFVNLEEMVSWNQEI